MKKRTLAICLSLLMLILTACGANEDAAQGSAQGYENTASENLQGREDTIPEISQSLEDDEPEISQSPEDAAQEATQGNENTVLESPESIEPDTPEQTSEPEDSEEETANDNLPTYGSYYYDVENVVLYLEIYDELPPNYITKSEAQSLGWEGGSVEKYKEGAAIGGDTFGNREGLLPAAAGRSYTECDIDTNGYSSRGSRRLVFSNDGLYFYTSDHYESFTEVIVTEDYEVIW